MEMKDCKRNSCISFEHSLHYTQEKKVLTGPTSKQETSFLQNNLLSCCYSKVLVVDCDQFQEEQHLFKTKRRLTFTAGRPLALPGQPRHARGTLSATSCFYGAGLKKVPKTSSEFETDPPSCRSPAPHAVHGRLSEDAPRPRGAINHGNNLPKYFRSTTRFNWSPSVFCVTLSQKPGIFWPFPHRGDQIRFPI